MTAWFEFMTRNTDQEKIEEGQLYFRSSVVLIFEFALSRCFQSCTADAIGELELITIFSTI